MSAPAAAPLNGWSPIETAPQDGTRILLFQKSSRGAFEGWWHDDWPHAEHYWMDDADSEPDPTHWRPLLPEPSPVPRPHREPECPSYPACEGGCGLGCTKEIERARAGSAATPQEPGRGAE